MLQARTDKALVCRFVGRTEKPGKSCAFVANPSRPVDTGLETACKRKASFERSTYSRCERVRLLHIQSEKHEAKFDGWRAMSRSAKVTFWFWPNGIGQLDP